MCEQYSHTRTSSHSDDCYRFSPADWDPPNSFSGVAESHVEVWKGGPGPLAELSIFLFLGFTLRLCLLHLTSMWVNLSENRSSFYCIQLICNSITTFCSRIGMQRCLTAAKFDDGGKLDVTIGTCSDARFSVSWVACSPLHALSAHCRRLLTNDTLQYWCSAQYSVRLNTAKDPTLL